MDDLGCVASPSYRERVYGRYVDARLTSRDARELLQSRRPFLVKLIRQHFPPDHRAQILELGCGYGALLHFAAAARYVHCRGVDVSSQQIALGRELGIAGLEEGDLLECLAKTRDESCDCVIAFDVIEHFTRPELLRFADSVYRVLRPDGRWLLHMPNGCSPFFGRIRYGDLTHELAFTPESLRQVLMASEFREVECYEDTPVIHGAASAVRWILWKAIRLGLRAWLAAETGATDGVLTQNFVAVAIK